MADLGINLNTNEYPTALPAGRYKAIVQKGELKQSKNGSNMIVFTFEVADAHVLISDYFCIFHPKTEVADIAKRKLCNLGRAVGVQNITNTDQLVNKILTVNLSVESDELGEHNTIKGYYPYQQPQNQQYSQAGFAQGQNPYANSIQPQQGMEQQVLNGGCPF